MESTIYHDEHGREMEFEELCLYLIDKGKRQAREEMAKAKPKEKEKIISLFYDYGQLAALLGYERKKVERMNHNGELPLPVDPYARRPKWVRTEIKAWVKSGMPSRLKWNTIKELDKEGKK